MKIDEVYACSLKAASLRGQEVTVTITGGEVRKVEDGKRKIVLTFAEFPQPLFLNVTNARKIASIHGDEATLWKGKQIVLVPRMTDFAGKEVECIRIEPVRAQPIAETVGGQSFQQSASGAVRF